MGVMSIFSKKKSPCEKIDENKDYITAGFDRLSDDMKVAMVIYRMDRLEIPAFIKSIEYATKGYVKGDVFHNITTLGDWLVVKMHYGPTYGGRAGALWNIDYKDDKPENHPLSKMDAQLKDYAKKKSA